MTTDDTLDLRNRLLLWHKVLCQITSTMALAYGGKGLSRAVLRDWSARVRSVSDDLDSITGIETSRLDAAGRRVLRSAGSTAPLNGNDITLGGDHARDLTKTTKLKGPQGPSPVLPKIEGRANPSKPLRKATRKTSS